MRTFISDKRPETMMKEPVPTHTWFRKYCCTKHTSLHSDTQCAWKGEGKNKTKLFKRHFSTLSEKDKQSLKSQISILCPCIFKFPTLKSIRSRAKEMRSCLINCAKTKLTLVDPNTKLSESRAQRALFRKQHCLGGSTHVPLDFARTTTRVCKTTSRSLPASTSSSSGFSRSSDTSLPSEHLKHRLAHPSRNSFGALSESTTAGANQSSYSIDSVSSDWRQNICDGTRKNNNPAKLRSSTDTVPGGTGSWEGRHSPHTCGLPSWLLPLWESGFYLELDAYPKGLVAAPAGGTQDGNHPVIARSLWVTPIPTGMADRYPGYQSVSVVEQVGYPHQATGHVGCVQGSPDGDQHAPHVRTVSWTLHPSSEEHPYHHKSISNKLAVCCNENAHCERNEIDDFLPVTFPVERNVSFKYNWVSLEQSTKKRHKCAQPMHKRRMKQLRWLQSPRKSAAKKLQASAEKKLQACKLTDRSLYNGALTCGVTGEDEPWRRGTEDKSNDHKKSSAVDKRKTDYIRFRHDKIKNLPTCVEALVKRRYSKDCLNVPQSILQKGISRAYDESGTPKGQRSRDCPHRNVSRCLEGDDLGNHCGPPEVSVTSYDVKDKESGDGRDHLDGTRCHPSNCIDLDSRLGTLWGGTRQTLVTKKNKPQGRGDIDSSSMAPQSRDVHIRDKVDCENLSRHRGKRQCNDIRKNQTTNTTRDARRTRIPLPYLNKSNSSLPRHIRVSECFGESFFVDDFSSCQDVCRVPQVVLVTVMSASSHRPLRETKTPMDEEKSTSIDEQSTTRSASYDICVCSSRSSNKCKEEEFNLKAYISDMRSKSSQSARVDTRTPTDNLHTVGDSHSPNIQQRSTRVRSCLSGRPYSDRLSLAANRVGVEKDNSALRKHVWQVRRRYDSRNLEDFVRELWRATAVDETPKRCNCFEKAIDPGRSKERLDLDSDSPTVLNHPTLNGSKYCQRFQEKNHPECMAEGFCTYAMCSHENHRSSSYTVQETNSAPEVKGTSANKRTISHIELDRGDSLHSPVLFPNVKASTDPFLPCPYLLAGDHPQPCTSEPQASHTTISVCHGEDATGSLHSPQTYADMDILSPRCILNCTSSYKSPEQNVSPAGSATRQFRDEHRRASQTPLRPHQDDQMPLLSGDHGKNRSRFSSGGEHDDSISLVIDLKAATSRGRKDETVDVEKYPSDAQTSRHKIITEHEAERFPVGVQTNLYETNTVSAMYPSNYELSELQVPPSRPDAPVLANGMQGGPGLSQFPAETRKSTTQEIESSYCRPPETDSPFRQTCQIQPSCPCQHLQESSRSKVSTDQSYVNSHAQHEFEPRKTCGRLDCLGSRTVNEQFCIPNCQASHGQSGSCSCIRTCNAMAGDKNTSYLQKCMKINSDGLDHQGMINRAVGIPTQPIWPSILRNSWTADSGELWNWVDRQRHTPGSDSLAASPCQRGRPRERDSAPRVHIQPVCPHGPAQPYSEATEPPDSPYLYLDPPALTHVSPPTSACFHTGNVPRLRLTLQAPETEPGNTYCPSPVTPGPRNATEGVSECCLRGLKHAAFQRTLCRKCFEKSGCGQRYVDTKHPSCVYNCSIIGNKNPQPYLSTKCKQMDATCKSQSEKHSVGICKPKSQTNYGHTEAVKTSTGQDDTRNMHFLMQRNTAVVTAPSACMPGNGPSSKCTVVRTSQVSSPNLMNTACPRSNPTSMAGRKNRGTQSTQHECNRVWDSIRGNQATARENTCTQVTACEKQTCSSCLHKKCQVSQFVACEGECFNLGATHRTTSTSTRPDPVSPRARVLAATQTYVDDTEPSHVTEEVMCTGGRHSKSEALTASTRGNDCPCGYNEDSSLAVVSKTDMKAPNIDECKKSQIKKRLTRSPCCKSTSACGATGKSVNTRCWLSFRDKTSVGKAKPPEQNKKCEIECDKDSTLPCKQPPVIHIRYRSKQIDGACVNKESPSCSSMSSTNQDISAMKCSLKRRVREIIQQSKQIQKVAFKLRGSYDDCDSLCDANDGRRRQCREDLLNKKTERNKSENAKSSDTDTEEHKLDHKALCISGGLNGVLSKTFDEVIAQSGDIPAYKSLKDRCFNLRESSQASNDIDAPPAATGHSLKLAGYRIYPNRCRAPFGSFSYTSRSLRCSRDRAAPRNNGDGELTGGPGDCGRHEAKTPVSGETRRIEALNSYFKGGSIILPLDKPRLQHNAATTLRTERSKETTKYFPPEKVKAIEEAKVLFKMERREPQLRDVRWNHLKMPSCGHELVLTSKSTQATPSSTSSFVSHLLGGGYRKNGTNPQKTIPLLLSDNSSSVVSNRGTHIPSFVSKIEALRSSHLQFPSAINTGRLHSAGPRSGEENKHGVSNVKIIAGREDAEHGKRVQLVSNMSDDSTSRNEQCSTSLRNDFQKKLMKSKKFKTIPQSSSAVTPTSSHALLANDSKASSHGVEELPLDTAQSDSANIAGHTRFLSNYVNSRNDSVNTTRTALAQSFQSQRGPGTNAAAGVETDTIYCKGRMTAQLIESEPPYKAIPNPTILHPYHRGGMKQDLKAPRKHTLSKYSKMAYRGNLDIATPKDISSTPRITCPKTVVGKRPIPLPSTSAYKTCSKMATQTETIRGMFHESLTASRPRLGSMGTPMPSGNKTRAVQSQDSPRLVLIHEKMDKKKLSTHVDRETHHPKRERDLGSQVTPLSANQSLVQWWNSPACFDNKRTSYLLPCSQVDSNSEISYELKLCPDRIRIQTTLKATRESRRKAWVKCSLPKHSDSEVQLGNSSSHCEISDTISTVTREGFDLSPQYDVIPFDHKKPLALATHPLHSVSRQRDFHIPNKNNSLKEELGYGCHQVQTGVGTSRRVEDPWRSSCRPINNIFEEDCPIPSASNTPEASIVRTNSSFQTKKHEPTLWKTVLSGLGEVRAVSWERVVVEGEYIMPGTEASQAPPGRGFVESQGHWRRTLPFTLVLVGETRPSGHVTIRSNYWRRTGIKDQVFQCNVTNIRSAWS